MPPMDKPRRCIKSLGEVALRVRDLDTMQDFYERVVGLELMKRFRASAFFKIDEGYGGHTRVLVLFDRSEEPGYQAPAPATTSVDHLAFEIDVADFDREKRRIEELGGSLWTAEHAWVHWRSLYVKDPEGNTVELVCYDESV